MEEAKLLNVVIQRKRQYHGSHPNHQSPHHPTLLMPALPRPSQVYKLLSKLKLCNNATDMDTLFNMMDQDGSGGCRAVAARSPAALTAAELCRRLAEPERILDCRRPSDRGGGRERGHQSVPHEDRLRRSATRCRAGGAMALTPALLGRHAVEEFGEYCVVHDVYGRHYRCRRGVQPAARI